MALYSLQEGCDHVLVQGLQLFADGAGEDTVVCRVGFDVAIGYGLLESLVEDAVEVADGLWCKPFFGQGIVVALDGVGVECVQLDSAQPWLDPGPDNALVIVHRSGLDGSQVFRSPNVQPLGHGHFAGGGIGTLIDGSGGGLQLLGHFFLGFAGDTALDLLAGAGIVALRESSFPVGVLLATPGNGLLADRAGAGCCFSCHGVFSFQIDTTAQR